MTATARKPRPVLARSTQQPEHLTFVRTARGLSQTQLADALGVGRSLICELEAGTRSATPGLLAAAALVLECPITVLERRVAPEWTR